MEDKIKSLKRKKIGVLMGGLSAEREISLKSGEAALKALLSLGYDAVKIDATRELPAKLKASEVEVAFIALHGRYGEDGCTQGLLEVIGIPYTGSGVMASAAAMDKAIAKVFFKERRVPTPDYEVITKDSKEVSIKPPLIVKPAKEGSAIGVVLVKKDEELGVAIEEALELDKKVIVESFIDGRELTVAIFDEKIFPVVEILPSEEIYNYKAKYVKGISRFEAPAKLSQESEALVKKVAMEAYLALGCEGVARVDIILDKEGCPYVLEVNTIPGLTELSLLPMAAKAEGLRYEALIEKMLLGAT